MQSNKDYFYVSSRVARQFSTLRESKIIKNFNTPWPKKSYQYTVNVSASYSSKLRIITSSISMVMIFLLTSIVSIPPPLQDLSMELMVATGFGSGVGGFTSIYAASPVVAMGSLLVLCIVLHFYAKWTAAASDEDLIELRGKGRGKGSGSGTGSSICKVSPLLPSRELSGTTTGTTTGRGSVIPTRRQSVLNSRNVLHNLTVDTNTGSGSGLGLDFIEEKQNEPSDAQYQGGFTDGDGDGLIVLDVDDSDEDNEDGDRESHRVGVRDRDSTGSGYGDGYGIGTVYQQNYNNRKSSFDISSFGSSDDVSSSLGSSNNNNSNNLEVSELELELELDEVESNDNEDVSGVEISEYSISISDADSASIGDYVDPYMDCSSNSNSNSGLDSSSNSSYRYSD